MSVKLKPKTDLVGTTILNVCLTKFSLGLELYNSNYVSNCRAYSIYICVDLTVVVIFKQYFHVCFLYVLIGLIVLRLIIDRY